MTSLFSRTRLERGFPLLAILFSLIAYYNPQAFVELKPAIIPLLGLIMFIMGLGLRAGDFRRVLRRPAPIAVVALTQFTVMPLAAWLLALALGLDTLLLVGMVLVGASAGGTASNVMCYLARGDVALSISMTLVSTLLAIFLMPLLTLLYAGHSIDIPAGQMLLSIIKIVLLPVVAGLILNTLAGAAVRKVQPALPLLAMAAIVFIIAIIVALNVDNLAQAAWPVLLAVMTHNALGLAAGYFGAHLCGYDPRLKRTMALEVGMQNSGLSVALAIKFFAAGAALPGALFSIWHNLSAAALAAWWNRRQS